MKPVLVEIVKGASSPGQALNDAREYLQARILSVLQRQGAMALLAFQGGTALRFLYATARYSEDLDFSLERHAEEYDFKAYLEAIRSELAHEAYAVNLKVSENRPVNSAFVRFPGLPGQLGLTVNPRETLSVKLEIDTNPPAGAVLETTVVRRYVPLRLNHHDRASLMAGKLHAVLQRKYVKGRDIYDLIWYLSDPQWPEPNLVLLNNALRQTGWEGGPLERRTWQGAIRDKVLDVKWGRVLDDVRPFLGPGADVSVMDQDNLRRLLEQAERR
jgi:hypothetical protein